MLGWYYRSVAEKKDWAVGGIVWKIVMVVTAIWLVVWMLKISGINVL